MKLPMRNSALWVWKHLRRSNREQAAVEPSGRLSWGGEDALEQCKQLKSVVIQKLLDSKHRTGEERTVCELEKSLVSLLAALFQSGYYHREEKGELSIDIAQV